MVRLSRTKFQVACHVFLTVHNSIIFHLNHIVYRWNAIEFVKLIAVNNLFFHTSQLTVRLRSPLAAYRIVLLYSPIRGSSTVSYTHSGTKHRSNIWNNTLHCTYTHKYIRGVIFSLYMSKYLTEVSSLLLCVTKFAQIPLCLKHGTAVSVLFWTCFEPKLVYMALIKSLMGA